SRLGADAVHEWTTFGPGAPRVSMPGPCSLRAAHDAAPLRPRASRLLAPALHRVHARVQRLVAGGVGGIEDAGIATRRVVRDPMVLHRGQAACQPGARYLATGELGGLPGEGPHDLSQRVTGHVEIGRAVV